MDQFRNLCPLASQCNAQPQRVHGPHRPELFSEEQRHDLESKLLHMQRLQSLGTFSGGIAHDFNVLLTGILGNACLAEDMTQEGTRLHECVMEIQELSRRAAELVGLILLFARNKEPKSRQVVLPEFVESLGSLIRSAVSNHIKVDFVHRHESVSVSINEVQFAQVLINLVKNAGEAMRGRTGGICVETGIGGEEDQDFLDVAGEQEKPIEFAFLRVTDNGCGMTPEVKERIFDPFYTTSQSGCGMGMATVRSIVDQYQGKIRIDSTPGAGTCCTVYFPVANQESPVCPYVEKY